MRFFSFDKQAQTYHTYSIPQQHFAKQLAKKTKVAFGDSFECVLDLGCGSGEMQKQFLQEGITFKEFQACDLSLEMLNLYPKEFQATLTCQDFESFLLHSQSFDLICSSSALQWAKNLENTLALIAMRARKVALGIITGNSLKSFHCFLNTTSPLQGLEEIQALFQRYFIGEMYLSCVNLNFSSNIMLCKHLKQTGILGGGVLSFSQAKKILDYQDCLEYESLIFVGKPK